MQVTMQVTDQFEPFHCQGVMSVIGLTVCNTLAFTKYLACININYSTFDKQLDLLMLQHSRFVQILCGRSLHRDDFFFFSQLSGL